MTEALVQVKNLSRYYQTNCAISHLNFTLKAGEVLGFLGPNGAGKSTTMQVITGNLAPSEGEVSIAGHDILEAPRAAKLQLGYLHCGRFACLPRACVLSTKTASTRLSPTCASAASSARSIIMRDLIKLVSTAGTGHYYTTDKNKKNTPDKLVLKKYDPVIRKHVEYKEAKIK